MRDPELQDPLADLFEVRLRRDRLQCVYELIAEKCGYSQSRLAEEVDDLAWNTVYRALNTTEGITLRSLKAMEVFIPILARLYAREKTSEELARLILGSSELEERLTRRLQGADEESPEPVSEARR